jgi:nitrogen regulatory protein PII
MQLLIVVVNREETLDDILSGFLELGITGATVIRSEGMGHVLASDVPLFAGLTELVTRTRPQNVTIFSVIREAEKVEAAIQLTQEVCGNLEQPATGILVVLPVSQAIGIAPELGEADR